MIKYSTKILPLGILAASSIAGASEQNPPIEKQPNIILIYADDIGYGDLSCYGGNVATPNVDKIAANGIRFTDGHCSSSTSTPSRYSMLTGEYAWRKSGTGIAKGDAAMIIKPDRFTIADMFTKAGYSTGVIGKWHLGLGARAGAQNWNKEIKPNPRDIGFQYSYIMAATADRTPCIFIENGKGVNLDSADPINVSYQKNFPGQPSGKENPELLRIHPSHGHNQAIVGGIPRIGFMQGGEKARWIDENIADVISAKSLEFIQRETAANKPFFLYLATNDIHVPRVPHQRFIGKSGMGPRGDALLSFDWTVGQVIKTIEKLGIEKNTIIIITSDNGAVLDDGYKDQAVELLGDHQPSGPLRGGKYSYYEGGTRIPFILSWPETVKPASSTSLVSQIDMLASFANMLGVEIPQGAAPDSKNHLSALMDAKVKARETLVEHAWGLALRQGNWKYIPGNKSTASQLYDLNADIGEKNNIAKEHPEIAAKMQKKLDEIKSQ